MKVVAVILALALLTLSGCTRGPTEAESAKWGAICDGFGDLARAAYGASQSGVPEFSIEDALDVQYADSPELAGAAKATVRMAYIAPSGEYAQDKATATCRTVAQRRGFMK